MIAILEKYEHNVDFHQIVYFFEASHIRIKTTDEGTKILSTDGKPRTISESLIRRNLKLNDEAEISSLPDAELFEHLALMGYNILPNQNFSFQKGQFSHQWKYLIHTIMQCLSPKSTGFNEFSSNIATAVGEGSRTPTEPHYTPSPEAQQSSPTASSSPTLPPATTATISTVIPTDFPTLRQYSRRARIAQSLVLPTVADEPASPLGDDSQGEACPTISGLEAKQDRANIIKTSTLPHDSTPRVTSFVADEGREEAVVEKSTERHNNDTEELVNVLTSLDAVSILTSRVQMISVPPAAEVATVSVPTGSGMVPTASPIFTTASVVTPYSRRKGKEKMVESDTPKKKKLQEQIDVQVAREMEEQIDREDQRMNENKEKIAKYLQEYEKFDADLSIGERIELINDLIEDFIPMGYKEEGERVKRKGLRLEQESAKKVKTSEEVSEKDIKTMMQLVPVEEVYVEALQVKHPIIDWEIHIEGQRNYWKIIRLEGNTAVY
nr:hypothetical protein [Tanacetum cinerariifolium]